MTIEKRDEAVRRRWAEMRENLERGSERVSNCNAGSCNCTHNADKIWWSRKNERGQCHFCNRVCLKYTFRCPHCSVMACVLCKKQQTTWDLNCSSVTGNEPQVLDLDPCLSPETFRPQVVTVDGKPKAIRCSGNGITQRFEAYTCGHLLPTSICQSSPRNKSRCWRNIREQVSWRFRHVAKWCAVRWPIISGIDWELRCLRRISAAGFDPPLRISRLCGVVGSGNNSVLGILLPVFRCCSTILVLLSGDPTFTHSDAKNQLILLLCSAVIGLIG